MSGRLAHRVRSGGCAVFVLKYFLYVGLALLGVIWTVDAWIEPPAPDNQPSQSNIVVALKEFAHRGEGAAAYQHAIRERMPQFASAGDEARIAAALAAARDASHNGQLAELKTVSDTRAEMPAKKAVPAKPKHKTTRTASRPRMHGPRIRVVENTPWREGGFFTFAAFQ